MADTVAVDVPAETAWAFVSDPRRLHELVPNTSVRLLSGSFDVVGSRYLVTTRATGQTLDATHEIVRFEPPRLIETRTTSHGTVGRSLMRVEPVTEHTCVLIAEGVIEWGGSMTAVVSRIMTAIVGRRTFAAALGRVKRAIEAEAGDDPSVHEEPHLAQER